MAFREKMMWGSVAATILIWGWYFLGFMRALEGPSFDVGIELGHFIFAVFALTVVQVVVAIVLAILSPWDASAPTDDRDREFALRAARPAYAVLSILVASLTVIAPLTISSAPAWLDGKPATLVPIVISNALLLALVLAELARAGTLLLLYRRGS